ncbi:MAG: hypothetical protein JSU72_01805 [Deltaproteobacteria bacterium]|nr:MAG: hypothetical protein JSU72_01805 [Deltaproteobacteria bacterium]
MIGQLRDNLYDLSPDHKRIVIQSMAAGKIRLPWSNVFESSDNLKEFAVVPFRLTLNQPS